MFYRIGKQIDSTEKMKRRRSKKSVIEPRAGWIPNPNDRRHGENLRFPFFEISRYTKKDVEARNVADTLAKRRKKERDGRGSGGNRRDEAFHYLVYPSLVIGIANISASFPPYVKPLERERGGR